MSFHHLDKHHQKLGSNPIHEGIKEFLHVEGRVSPIAKRLSEYAAISGLDEDEFKTLFESIFEVPLIVPIKKYILKKVLIPSGQFEISVELMCKIISSIGVPEVYHKNGKKQKLKLLPIQVQQALLEWLVCSIHFFGLKAYLTLQRLQSMLFNMLSFEFLRPSIANLIFLSIVNSNRLGEPRSVTNKTLKIYPFKPWHVQYVVDLYLRFPSDNSLKSLIALFKFVMPSLDYSKFCKEKNAYDLNFSSTTEMKTFGYPNNEFLNKLSDIRLINRARSLNLIAEKDHIMEANLKHYENFSKLTNKRRKKNQRYNHSSGSMLLDEIDLDVLDFSSHSSTTAVSINDITSNANFINNLEHIKFINVNRLFTSVNELATIPSTEKYKKLFLIFQGLTSEGTNDALTKLEYFIRLSFLDENLSLRDLNGLSEGVCDFLLFSSGVVSLRLIVDYIAFKFDSCASSSDLNFKLEKHENLLQRLKLLKYLPIPVPGDFEKSILLNLIASVNIKATVKGSQKLRTSSLVRSLILELSTLLKVWYSKISHSKSSADMMFQVFEIINITVPQIYALFIDQNHLMSLDVKFVILEVFDFIKSIDSTHLQEFAKPETIFVPPALAYSLIFDTNPLIVSEFCGFISCIKTYKYSESHKNYQVIQNTYVMDTLNFLWRNKAFQYDSSYDSSSKAFSLEPSFINKLGSLSNFSFDNFVNLRTVGNVFHNPCFSYITAEIVWNLEDQIEGLSRRHAGPITEESVLHLLHDPEHIWLELNYDELRLRVLRKLDTLGYSGICDLLFSSLKTLTNRRGES